MKEPAKAPHPPWMRTARPERDDCVLPFMLQRNARLAADREQFCFADGRTWTCAETLDCTRRTAAYFREQGIGPGDFVLAWLPNGPDMLRVWFAANWLGAVFVPMNLDYRGSILRHAIVESSARVLVAHPRLVERLDLLEDLPLERVLSVNGAAELANHAIPVIETSLADGSGEVAEPADLNAWDLQMVIFTSGTTGPSKGVMCPYLHMWTTGHATYGYLDESDCMLVELPAFHVGGVAPVMAGLAARCRIAIYPGFRTDEFWQRIEARGATTTSGLIGSMASFLDKSPARKDDANNSLRMITLMLNRQAMDVARRFGFSYVSGFNMTELSGPLVTEIDCAVPGSLGRPRDGCECRVVDDHDYECPPGVAGELVVRMDQPWTCSMGYLNRPQATADAWRNGWFHTGDLVRCDEEGNFFFVDRKKDAVRRRGENVSSIEVEAEVIGHPSIAEAAIVGIASEHGDQEILAAIVPRSGASVDLPALVGYLAPRMPHYMVPRYFRVMDALPRTPTNKVRKIEIREEGVTPDTWDREAANLRLRRTHLD